MGTEMPPLNDASLGTNTGPTSDKKIEANRRNAQSSTGPKSLEGKKNVSRNARKHSLLAKDVVITSGEGREDQAEFDALLTEMRDCHRPVGAVEDLLVQEIAISYWRSGRALRSERGALTSRPGVPEGPELTQAEELLIEVQGDEARFRLFGSSHRLNYLLQKAEEIRREVESSGRISRESNQWLSLYLGGSWSEISGKQALLATLEKKTTELSTRKMQIEEYELRLRNVRIDCSAVPSMEALNRISRYETTNVRHRERVLRMLEQFQSQRKQRQKAIPGAGDKGEGPQNG